MLPPPLPNETSADAQLPPPAPLFPRMLAFLADAALALLFGVLATRLLVPVFAADTFPVFVETLREIAHDYRETALSLADGNTGAAAAFSERVVEKASRPEVADAQLFVSLTLSLTALAYFTLSETLTRGASLGKKIFRLRVVSTVTGGTPNVLQSLSRSIWRACAVAPTGLLVTLLLIVDAHVPFFAFRRRAWHDRLSRTEVVDARNDESARGA
ncbi:MAG: RDD family protein [Candidatus Spyradosoma sp.]